MGMVKPWHIIVLAVVLILLFGAKRLPDMARGLGRSLRILKAETKGLAEDNAEPQTMAGAGRPSVVSYSDDQPSPLFDPVRPRVHDK